MVSFVNVIIAEFVTFFVIGLYFDLMERLFRKEEEQPETFDNGEKNYVNICLNYCRCYFNVLDTLLFNNRYLKTRLGYAKSFAIIGTVGIVLLVKYIYTIEEELDVIHPVTQQVTIDRTSVIKTKTEIDA